MQKGKVSGRILRKFNIITSTFDILHVSQTFCISNFLERKFITKKKKRVRDSTLFADTSSSSLWNLQSRKDTIQ